MEQQKLLKETNAPGAPKEDMIPLSIPSIEGNEWQYIKECLDTGWVSSVGRYVDQFEQSIADYLGCEYAVACISGTAALHTALLLADVQPEEEVLVPALTFISPVNAVRYVGAWPVFIDVQSDIWQMDPQKIRDFLKGECEYKNGQCVNRHTKRIVSAIMPVHILGHPVDMEPIIELARQFNLMVIEDAAESLGATYKGKQTGSLGDIGCLSFNGNKIITTGGGGMIVTNNKHLAQQARYFTTQAKDDSLEYIHHNVGYNYRLSNIQAAMGVAQMERLEDYVIKKRNIANRYNKAFKDISSIALPKEEKWAQSTFWLYTILLNPEKCRTDTRSLIKNLIKEGIEARPLWHPAYKLKPFADCYSYHIDVADQLYERAVSLPSSVCLTDDQQDKVINVIKKALS